MRLHEFDCQTCGIHVTKKLNPQQYDKPPKFCSNPCKFKAMNKQRPTFTCRFCGSDFTAYVAPGDKKGYREFCSRSCELNTTHLKKGRKLSTQVTSQCEGCGVSYTYKHKSTKQLRRYCSRACAAQHIVIPHTFEEYHAKWAREHGEEKAIEMVRLYRERRSELSSGENNGDAWKVPLTSIL